MGAAGKRQHVHLVPQVQHDEKSVLSENRNDLAAQSFDRRSEPQRLVINVAPQHLELVGEAVVREPGIRFIEMKNFVLPDER